MKIVICDDVAAERQPLRAALRAYFSQRGEAVEIVEYGDGASLVDDVAEGYLSFDLGFFDIFMDDLNGMEAVRRLRQLDINSPLIFLTTTADFAVESYEVHAAGYLLKPLIPEKLSLLLDHILQPAHRRQISVKCKSQFRYFYVDEITWAASDRHVVTIHLADGSHHTTSEKLNTIEALLDDGRFLRCHQSFLVNMDFIRDVETDFLLENGDRVPIRTRSHKQLTDTYRAYFVAKAIANLPGGDGYV